MSAVHVPLSRFSAAEAPDEGTGVKEYMGDLRNCPRPRVSVGLVDDARRSTDAEGALGIASALAPGSIQDTQSAAQSTGRPHGGNQVCREHPEILSRVIRPLGAFHMGNVVG